MMKKLIFSFLALAVLLTTGCAKPPKQVLGVPTDLKEAIEKNVLAQGYAIYATGHPARVEDLLGNNLIACGCNDTGIDETLASTFQKSLQVQIFPSSEVLKIADNVSCQGTEACMTLEENIRSSGQDMSEVQLRRINMFYGKSTTKSTLMQTCLERAQDAGKSVIVVPRNVAMRPVDGLVELKFEQTTSPVEMASGEAFAVMITTLVGTKQGSSDKVNFQWGNLTVRLMDGNQVEAAATIEQIKQYNEGKTSVKLWKKSDGKWIVASLEAPLRQIGPKVQVAAPNKVIISAGMAAGMLIQKTAPLYPPIAKAARVQGTLVLQVDISKTGSIENLRVISGPAMLQQAALDAVKTWRYRPYLVNNQPVEVETTVNVIFTLGG